ncbi:hypothetical protein Vi05172_g8838 [Venturia inaequalis]|uniref:Uncharacterized protein n=1 Tax=Venturia inaequalis TaxID=5025 RepID=A0A8H3URF8_VENIN|nr:hypothetical protein EG327_009101 [Venturia inaequalis]RDI81289.1 hypothetical protein Vi05172_g8838 [Venturia inaequalis]
MTRRIAQREAYESSQSQAQSQSTTHSTRETEEYEVGSKASASGSLNLNIFAGLSGVFGSKKTTTTDTAPDGSSKSVENTDGVGHVKGVGAGTLDAQANAEAKDYAKKTHAVEEGTEQSQKQGQVQQVNHLGIEG